MKLRFIWILDSRFWILGSANNRICGYANCEFANEGCKYENARICGYANCEFANCESNIRMANDMRSGELRICEWGGGWLLTWGWCGVICGEMKTEKIVYAELSYMIMGVLFAVHNELGKHAAEKEYGDMIADELRKLNISFDRELPLGTHNTRRNRADFLIEHCIILELKSVRSLTRQDYFQVRRYLEAANMRLGILVNFRSNDLTYKRILNPTHP